MGVCLLCEREPAAEPFYVESVRVNLYSGEELCWFLANNIPLADEDVLSPSLADWLKDMCGYEESEGLKIALAADDGGVEGFKMIMKTIRYYSEAEAAELIEKMEKFEGLSPAERMKERADVLLRYGKVIDAAKGYEAAARTTGITESPGEFQSGIYYSCGCAYAKLFRMKKAAECFEKAYDLFPDEKARNALLYIAYIDGGEEAFSERAREFGTDEEAAAEMLDEINALEIPPVPDDLKSAVSGWIKDYHEGVG